MTDITKQPYVKCFTCGEPAHKVIHLPDGCAAQPDVQGIVGICPQHEHTIEPSEQYHVLCDFTATTPDALAAKDAEIGRLRKDRNEIHSQLNVAQLLIKLLRDDLAYFAEGGADDFCEGCNAPLRTDEDVATTEDVRGCWGYVADVKDAPCFRYRTESGEDRAWPYCAALGKDT